MNPFDLHTAPLAGISLIEAGAGTGKTYTLTGIFLRLIVEQGFQIDQILVVTYTKAATEELKTRIRHRLLQAKAAFENGQTDDDLLLHMMQISDQVRPLQYIKDALTNFDRAAIFTIHGFCQRLLQHFAFETGQLFQTELVQDQQTLFQEVADDFWRRYISNAPYELARYALDIWKGPEGLMPLLNYSRYPSFAIVSAGRKPSLSAVAPWRQNAGRLVKMWNSEKQSILDLLTDPGLNARTYGKCDLKNQKQGLSPRQMRLKALERTMDLWNGKYPMVDAVERFSTSCLERSTKKKHQTPQHPFFEICQETVKVHSLLTDQMANYLRFLKIRLLTQARQRLNDKKRRKNILFFDDLLQQVYQALQKKTTQELLTAVRAQYKAALVDEFQDTDPIQYEIFQRLFDTPSKMLVMIGDPKQAIYSFRGADIFSYLMAGQIAQMNATLTKNWRSTPMLVQAVNTIFGNHNRPFGFEKIQFNPAEAANPSLIQDGHPLTIWCLDGAAQKSATKPISQETAVAMIAGAVSEEILGLITDSSAPFKPAQIAILTRTHRQSQIMKKSLATKGIPAVLHSAGSVFDTSEAESLGRLMAAVAAPNDPVAVSAALVSDLFDVQALSLYFGRLNPSEQWQKRWNAFARDHRIWIQHGFNRMFRGVLLRENIKGRLLAKPEGERRLTNLLHLAELLHHAETQYRLAPQGLIQWFTARRQALDKGSEEQQLRLESDAQAVRIITMHKSKGLQFDVVFCPFTWSGVLEDKNAVMFHNPVQKDQLTLAIGPEIAPDHQLQARKEGLSENIRMLYVALTRARLRCYMVWGWINRTEVSAPSYLFHTQNMDIADNDWISPLVQKIGALDHHQIRTELNTLTVKSDQSIVVKPIPESTTNRYRFQKKQLPPSGIRTMSRIIRPLWRIASFSSLTAGQSEENRELPERDAGDSTWVEPSYEVQPYADLFGFPRGADAGLFFHDILEHWDHTANDPLKWEEMVSKRLHAHGFDRKWQPTVLKLLDNLARTPLKSESQNFTLSQVPLNQRVNEMEFHFPLKSFRADALQKVFRAHGTSAVQKQVDRLKITAIQGYLKGFIDTVFNFEGRYYLVDWKSNYLGDDYAGYREPQLADVIAMDNYFLQYTLYVIALDQFLKQRIKNYYYKEHFGGVFYIFLRGINDSRDGASGVFYDRPTCQLVSELRTLLIGSWGK